ncbi:MAG: ThuA domain-containing protein [Verrucomicrobiota bacterium]
MRKCLTFSLTTVLFILSTCIVNAHGFRVLVFTKTAGFQHGSIPDGVAAVQELGLEHDFDVTVTDDASVFISELPSHNAVLFLNTSGDVLNASQQSTFQAWYQSGRAFVGIHAAADTEHNWQWYRDLVGAIISNHSGIVNADVKFLDQIHPITNITNPVTSERVEIWQANDEWYNFQASPRGDVHVLAIVDEDTYSGGTHGGDHPIAWCQEFDGGRSAFLGMGHTSEIYDDPIFRDLITNALEWSVGEFGGDSQATIDSNYQVQVLANFNNPMSIDIDDDGNVYVIERTTGNVRRYNPSNGQTTTLDNISVYSGGEFGMLGIALAPDFSTSNHIYLFYSLPQTGANQRLSRYTLTGSGLTDERVILEFPVERPDTPGVGNNPQGHHQAGCMRFDADGNLLISIGDNTDASGFAPRNDNRLIKDARRASANTNDLRGKIIRIKPDVGQGPAAHPNYTIPAGNLFSQTTSTERAEIYVMGARNPFRFSIDPHTGWLYYGDVGPDALNDGGGSFQGPAGHDEFNQVRSAGNFGWPYYIGFNRAYRDGSGNEWTPATISSDLNSYFNRIGVTAETTIPSPLPAWITYTYLNHLGFPEMRKQAEGIREGRAVMAGPVYEWRAGASDNAFPRYHDKTVFLFDFTRGLVAEAKTDSDGNLLDLKRFLPNQGFSGPIDMMFGPDGMLYYIELYNGSLRRIAYSAGNLRPTAIASADQTSGPLPLSVQFTGDLSSDQEDGSNLTYSWDFGDGTPNSSLPNPSYVYQFPGTYNVQLVVTDTDGLSANTNLTIYAGNSAPTIAFDAPYNNSFFDWGDDIGFDIVITDAEDGSSANGAIDPANVLFEGSLGHVRHQHNESQINALRGTDDVARDDSHGFDDDVYYVFDAYFTDQGAPGVGPISVQATSTLRPKILMAQLFDENQGVTIQATQDPLGGVEDVSSIDDGDWICFQALNLYQIEALRFRLASVFGGTIEVRSGSPTGPLLATASVSPTGGNDQYTDTTVSIAGTSTPIDLYFVFENTSNPSDIFRLNWIGFRGQGATTYAGLPQLTEARMLSSNFINLVFDQAMDYATTSDPSNYSLDNGATVTDVTISPDQESVTLTTTTLANGNYYNLSVSGCEDLAGDAIADSSFVLFNSNIQDAFFLGINAGGTQYEDSEGRVWFGEIASVASSRLINVDFNDSTPENMSGPAAVGNSGDLWNSISVSGGWTSINGNNLTRANGGTSNISMNLSSFESSGGALDGFFFEQGDLPDSNIATSIESLTSDYTYMPNTNNSGNNSSNAGAYFIFTLTGLDTNLDYDLYLYGSADGSNQGARFTYNGVSRSTVNSTTNRTDPVEGEDYVVFNSARPASDGSITVRIENNGAGTQWFNIAGFQLFIDDGTSTPVNYHSTSNTFSNGDSISGTDDDPLYQSERWATTDIDYTIPIESGTYDVTLKFAEIFFTSSNSRLFNVQIEGGGNIFSPDLDIYAQAGHDTALDHVIRDVTVIDGSLDISIVDVGEENPKISAIAIERPAKQDLPDDSFAEFISIHYTRPVGLATNDENDQQGLLEEYAFGNDPFVSDNVILDLTSSGADFDFAFERPIGLIDLEYTIEVSPNLLDWFDLSMTPQTSPIDGTMERVTYSDLESAVASIPGFVIENGMFVRINVSLTPIPAE